MDLILSRIPTTTLVLYIAVTHHFRGYVHTQNSPNTTPELLISWPELESGQNQLPSGQNGPQLGEMFGKWAKLVWKWATKIY